MRVVKFGGSSVANVARLRHVARLVAHLRAQAPVAVVVSAMAGVTDALIGVGRSAIAGDPRLPDLLDEVAWRHAEAWVALVGGVPDEFERQWAALTQDARTLAWRGAGLGVLTRERLIADFSGWGERLVVGLLAAALREAGLAAEAFADAPVALRGAANVEGEPEPSALATRAWLSPRLAMLALRGGVPTLPGYIARDATGALTTLGRNGSDHSAAVVAAALGAESLTIYSDVPGMLTADPRVAADAALLPVLTYNEARRVATLGARALHPATIEPIARWGIPLALREAARPDGPGTDIIPSAAAWGRARPGAWIVTARPLVGQPVGEVALAEVAAVWLPAWLRVGARIPRRDLSAALASLPFGVVGVREMADGACVLALADRAEAITRALHTALRERQRVRHPPRSASLATGA